MSIVLWCCIGAVLAVIAMRILPLQGRSNHIESLLVGMFGAIIGGEIPALSASGGLQAAAIGSSIAGGVVLLVLLAVMRRAVGPLKPRDPRKRRRD